MKKTYIQIALLFVTSFLLYSCDKSEGLGAAPISLDIQNYEEVQILNIGEKEPVYLISRKAWTDKVNHKIEYKIDNNLVEQFNQKNKMSLKVLPADIISADSTSFILSDKSKKATFKFFVNPMKYSEEIGVFDSPEYAVGYQLYVDDKPILSPIGQVVIAFNFQNAELGFVGSQEINVSDDSQDFLVNAPYELNFHNPYSLSFTPEISKQLVDEYNKAHGTNYYAYDTSKVEAISNSLRLERGSNTGTLSFIVDKMNFQTGITLLPITLSQISSSSYIGHPTPVITLSPKNKVFYCFFKYQKKSYIDQSNLSVSTGTIDPNEAPKIIDGNVSGSYWKSFTKVDADGTPINIDLSIKKGIAKIYGVEIAVAADMESWNMTGPKIYKIYSSDNGSDWELCDTFMRDMSHKFTPATYFFSNFKSYTTKYIRISITESIDEGNAIAEIRLLGEMAK